MGSSFSRTFLPSDLREAVKASKDGLLNRHWQQERLPPSNFLRFCAVSQQSGQLLSPSPAELSKDKKASRAGEGSIARLANLISTGARPKPESAGCTGGKRWEAGRNKTPAL
jgi:hypothetical protein